MKLLLLGSFILASEMAFAAGSAEGTMLDLIPAFINLFILLGILGYILRKPVKNHYVEKSNGVRTVLERASVKAKEAEMMMEAQKKKINGVASEIDRIYKETEENIRKYKSGYSADVDERIVKMKEDAALKIEAEKTEQMNRLNSSFMDEVISRAKSFIKNNPELGNQATNKVLEGLKK